MFNRLRVWLLALLCLANLSQAAFVGYHDGTHAADHISAATSRVQEFRLDIQDCFCGTLHITGRDSIVGPSVASADLAHFLAVEPRADIPDSRVHGIASARAPPLSC